MCFFIVDGEKQGQALHGSVLSHGPQGRVHPHHEATRDIASVRDGNISQKTRDRNTERQRHEDGPGG